MAVRAGVIGVGYLGRLHAQKLASFDDVRFAGVYDADVARGKAVAEECGTSFFDSHRRLLAEVDAVTIAVPTTAHHRVAMDAQKRVPPKTVSTGAQGPTQQAARIVGRR